MTKKQKEIKKAAFWEAFKKDVEYPGIDLRNTERFYCGYLHGLYLVNVLNVYEVTKMQETVQTAVNYQIKLRKEDK